MATVDRPRVRLAGVGQATDTHAVAERPDPTELTAVRLAAGRSLAMAGRVPADVDVAELHDAFTILEIVQSEEAGFFAKGEGHLALEKGETALGGALPINTSGGLKGRGHPVGATGARQVATLLPELRRRNAKYGLVSMCVGGGQGGALILENLKRNGI